MPDDTLESMCYVYGRLKGSAVTEIMALIALGTHLHYDINPLAAALLERMRSQTLQLTREMAAAMSANRYARIRVPLEIARPFA